MTTIRIDEITESDYLAAYQLAARLDGDRLAIAIIGSLIAFGAGIFLIAQRSLMGFALGAGLASAAIGAWIGAAIVRLVVLPTRARRTHQSKALRAPSVISWDDDRLRFESEYEGLRLPWGDVVRTKEDDRSLLIYVTDNVFRLIPKRVFAGSESLAQLREQLQRATNAA